MLKISLKKLNDFIQPLGYTVAIVRDDKEDVSGPYHSIWFGENDEFIYKSNAPKSEPEGESDPFETPLPPPNNSKGM